MTVAYGMSWRIVEVTCASLRARGFEPAALLEELRIPPESAQEGGPDVRHEQGVRLLERACEITGDPTFSLHTAEHYQPGAHVFEYLTPNSPNIGVLLSRVDRYYGLIIEGLRTQLTVDGGQAVWSLRLADGLPMPTPLADLLVGVAVIQSRRWTAREMEMMHVCLARPEPADPEYYRKVLRTRVSFGQQANEIRFPEAGLQLPLPMADPVLARVLERQASDMLEKQEKTDDLLSQVRSVLADQLAQGDVQIERTAKVLGTSARTLRRRLSEQGATHRALLDEVRQARAEQYLREGKASVDEVAFLLGFSDAPSFHRAFKRWTGKTPARFRRGE